MNPPTRRGTHGPGVSYQDSEEWRRHQSVRPSAAPTRFVPIKTRVQRPELEALIRAWRRRQADSRRLAGAGVLRAPTPVAVMGDASTINPWLRACERPLTPLLTLLEDRGEARPEPGDR